MNALAAGGRPPALDLILPKPDPAAVDLERAGGKKLQEALAKLAPEEGLPDEEGARPLLAEAATAGNRPAALHLAVLLHLGRGGAEDFGGAERLYRLAVEENLATAMVNLGALLARTPEGGERTAEALEWSIKAADLGDPVGAGNAASLLLWKDKEANSSRAREFLTRAANSGHSPAQSRLGFLLTQGNAVGVDMDEGLRWLRRAADSGDPPAAYALGLLCMEGKGIPQDDRMAVRWFRKAAEAGNPYAATNLGAMHEEGKGVEKDIDQAILLYQTAADQGAVGALFNLARLLLGREPERAFPYAEQAAEKGIPPAMNLVGELYRDGVGAAPNPVRAKEYFERAASAGFPDAKFNLAMAAINGIGMPADLRVGIRKLNDLASEGNVRAQNNLGAMLRDGKGIKRDYAAALALFERAAEAGFPPAMCNLAYMLEFGFGASIDDKRSIALYKRAAELGDAYAKAKLAHLTKLGVLAGQ